MTAVLGLDIGGTHARGRLDRDGAVSEAQAPSASLTAAGQRQAAASLGSLLAALGLSAGSGLDAVCAGTAGSGSSEAEAFLRSVLCPLTSGGPVLVVNDARLVLAGAGLTDGIACVSGTGSICVGILGRREERAGGWGYLLGDEGSGYWVAREAVRELADRYQEHAPLGELGRVLLARAGCADVPSLVDMWHEQPAPRSWAELAPAVLGCEDRFGPGVVRKAAACLAFQVGQVHRRLGAPAGFPVVLAGGLVSRHAALGRATTDAVLEELPRSAVTVTSEPPVAGAVALALSAAGGRRNGK